MFLLLLFKLMLLTVLAQSDEYENPDNIRMRTPSEKAPNFCDEHYIDLVFSNEKSQIRMTRKNWTWTYDQIEKRLGKAEKQNPTEIYLMQSKIHISTTPECGINSNSICTDIRRAKDIIIILFKERNTDFNGSYQVRKVVNGVVTNIEDTAVLPFGLERTGNIYSSGQLFWPKELSSNENQYDKKHTAIIYSPNNYEIVIVVNSYKKEYQKVFFNRFDPQKSWPDNWESKTIDHEWVYIGMFLMNNNIYVVGTKGKNSRVFIYAHDHQLRDTELTLMRYLGCRQSYDQLDKSEEKSDSKSIVCLIVGFFVVIIVFAIFIFIIFLRKNKNKPNSETKQDLEQRITLRPINKGEVEETKIGALSSKLNWNMKVSEISTASGKLLDIKAETPSRAKK